jgi:hypothetical protein
MRTDLPDASKIFAWARRRNGASLQGYAHLRGQRRIADKQALAASDIGPQSATVIK